MTERNKMSSEEVNEHLAKLAKVTPPKPVESPRDAKSFMRDIFPEAYAYDTKRGGFDIVDCIDKDRAMSIGYGKTEEAAWNDARNRQTPAYIDTTAPVVLKTELQVAGEKEGIVPCHACNAPVFLYGSGNVVPHFGGDGLRCSANGTRWIAPKPAPRACEHKECEEHSVTEVNGAGVHLEVWLECVACRETFDYDPRELKGTGFREWLETQVCEGDEDYPSPEDIGFAEAAWSAAQAPLLQKIAELEAHIEAAKVDGFNEAKEIAAQQCDLFVEAYSLCTPYPKSYVYSNKESKAAMVFAQERFKEAAENIREVVYDSKRGGE